MVEGYQRRDAEQLAAQARPQRLALGADLWADGVQLADVLGPDGAVDETKVNAAVLQVLSSRPHWRASAGNIDQGVRDPAPGGITFADVLRGGMKRGTSYNSGVTQNASGEVCTLRDVPITEMGLVAIRVHEHSQCEGNVAL